MPSGAAASLVDRVLGGLSQILELAAEVQHQIIE
jgi:hypothetical protein